MLHVPVGVGDYHNPTCEAPCWLDRGCKYFDSGVKRKQNSYPYEFVYSTLGKKINKELK